MTSETCVCVTWLLAKASSFAGANGCKPLAPWPCSSILTLPCVPAPLQLLVWIHTWYSVFTAASTASCCLSCWSSSPPSANHRTDSHWLFPPASSARQLAVSHLFFCILCKAMGSLTFVLLHPLQGKAQTLSESQ